MNRLHLFVVITAVHILLPVQGVHASIFVPAGLMPGDSYQLAFVTRDGRTARSKDVADYNVFVQSQTGLNPSLTGTDLGIQWSAIVSTASVPEVHARDNAVVSAPIYLFDSTLISTTSLTLYGGSLVSPLDVDQFGTELIGFNAVWTGSNDSGLANSPLGQNNRSRFGSTSFSNEKWLSAGVIGVGEIFSFYALSEPLVVPQSNGSAVPEPTSILVWGLIGAVGLRRRKRKRE